MTSLDTRSTVAIGNNVNIDCNIYVYVSDSLHYLKATNTAVQELHSNLFPSNQKQRFGIKFYCNLILFFSLEVSLINLLRCGLDYDVSVKFSNFN